MFAVIACCCQSICQSGNRKVSRSDFKFGRLHFVFQAWSLAKRASIGCSFDSVDCLPGTSGLFSMRGGKSCDTLLCARQVLRHSTLLWGGYKITESKMLCCFDVLMFCRFVVLLLFVSLFICFFLFCCFVVLLRCCFAVLVCCCWVVLLFLCFVVLLLCCFVVLLFQ